MRARPGAKNKACLQMLQTKYPRFNSEEFKVELGLGIEGTGFSI